MDELFANADRIIELLKEHAAKVRKTKVIVSRLERWASRAQLAGFVILGMSLLLALAGSKLSASKALLIVSSIGLVVLIAGLIASILHAYRTSKRPFDEYADNILASLPKEKELFAKLECFDQHTLLFVHKRIEAQSRKVTSFLEWVGGDRMATSVVATAVIGFLLVVQYSEVAAATLTMDNLIRKGLPIFGFACLLGISIGASFATRGKSQSLHYADLLQLVIDKKESQK